MAGWAVFLSYVEATHDDETRDLKVALEAAGISTFRFKEDVPSGEPFGSVLADALLGSRVVVVFLDAAFLERPNCRWELNAVLAAGDLAARLVIARPVSDSIPNGLAGVPPAIASRRWPRANDTDALVALVRERLAANPPTLAEALGESSASELRAQLLETSVLPPPELLADIPHAPDPLPASIDEAFVGRSETLWRIDHALRLCHGLGTRVRSTVSLEGGGGTGKTRLAREYVRRYGSHYRGGIYWIDGTGRVDEQLHAVLRVLDPGVPSLVELRKREVDIKAYVRRTFEEHPSTDPLLWVVDTVPEASLRDRRPERAPSLDSLCPVRGEVALLLTSRVMISTISPSIERVPVPALPGDAAVTLLVRGVDRTALSVDQWESIARWVGRLPLALTLLNAALAAGTIAAAELARHAGGHGAMTPILDSTMASLRKAGLSDLEPGALRGVSEAFAISHDLLDDDAKSLLRLLAQLAPDPIPEALLGSLGAADATPGARTALRTRSFIESAPGLEMAAFGQLHVVLADFVRTAHPASATEMRLLRDLMLRLFDPDIVGSPASWPLLNALLPHATAICGRMDDIAFGGDVEQTHDLELGMASVLFAQGSYAGAGKLQEQVLDARTGRLGFGHPTTLAAAQSLAITLSTQGDYVRARELEERVLEGFTRLLGPNHPNTLRVTDNLGIMTRRLGDLAEAHALEEQAADGLTSRLGRDDPSTLRAAHNRATALFAQGDVAGARALEEQVLEGFTRVLGSEHPDTLRAENNLAALLHAQNDYATARGVEEKLLATRTRVLGPEHPETLGTANNLAVTLYFLGEHQAALELAEQVLATRTRVLGPQHPETVKTAGFLSMVKSGESGRQG